MSSRPLKFRLWLNKESRYLYQDGFTFLASEGKAYTPMDYDGGLEELDGVIERFTGIQDTKGKDIYEGDILAVKHETKPQYANGKVFWGNEYLTYHVKYWYPGKADYYSDYLSSLHNTNRVFEVCGNIHQNEDLL